MLDTMKKITDFIMICERYGLLTKENFSFMNPQFCPGQSFYLRKNNDEKKMKNDEKKCVHITNNKRVFII